MKLTNFKIIISGSTIEAYHYKEKGVRYDFTKPKGKGEPMDKNLSPEDELKRKIEIRKISMQRSRSTLRRLVNANAWKWLKSSGKPYLPVFVTLTFKEDVRDTKISNKIFSKFIKRFNYYITDGNKKGFLKYVVVIEFQDFSRDGVVHYHIVFFNMKKVWKDTIFEIWEQGIVDIKKIGNVDNIGAYISKYMSKHFEDNRLDGKKRYFSSRGLFKPVEICDPEIAYGIIKQIPQKYLVREKEFESQYLGKVKYKQYKLNKNESIFDLIPDLKNIL
jgi:hypothetical protein